MTNPHRGELEISLAGQSYQTRLNLDSIARIENQLGKSIVKIAGSLSEGDLTVSEIAIIIHKALRGGGNNVDMKDVNQLLWDAGIAEAMRCCGEILAGVFGVSDSGNEQEVSE